MDGGLNISGMPKRGPHRGTKKPTPPQWRRTFIKQWRIYRGKTVETLAEEAGLSVGNVSAIENQRQGYSAESLAALADALRTTPGALLTVNPDEEATGDFWHIWGQASEAQRGQLAEIARTLVRPKKA